MRPEEEIDRVMELFRREFPEAELLDPPHWDVRRGTVLFRATAGRGKYELEIPVEALEDHPVSEDLKRQSIGELLKERPNMRLPYIHLSRRVLPEEQLFVNCDGKRYRIQQQKGGHVNIFDEHDQPLAHRTGTRLLSGSIHRRSEEEWQQEIRGQRGEGQ